MIIWRTLFLIVLMLCAMAAAKARAAECPNNPSGLGTSRVIAIDPREIPRVGVVQYSQSLPLEDKEVVLTFDDGPLPPYTNRVLDVLAEHCVKANYFLVGRMARGYPDLTRRIVAEGHTIGTHSENHLLGFDRAPIEAVKAEIEQGIASVNSVAGGRSAATSFFRIPGFLRRQEVETYLQSRRLMTWSADVVADDWKHINAYEVVRRTIARLDEKGKGIVLLHDIQPATALALPELLRQLKAKGYRIVQVVPRADEISVPMAARPAPLRKEPAPGPVAASVSATLTPIVPPRVAVTAAAAPATAPAPVAVARPEVTAVTVVKQEVAAVAVVKPAVATAAVAKPDATPLQHPARDEPDNADTPVQRPAISASAANSLARAHDIPRDPVRPLTSGSKPARNMPTPEKFVTTEPGGWPRVISVPVPAAGGVGVSSITRRDQTPAGRFQ